jgi:hypothetical protein
MFVWNNFTDNYLYIAIIINCIINLLYHYYIIAKELFIIVQNKTSQNTIDIAKNRQAENKILFPARGSIPNAVSLAGETALGIEPGTIFYFQLVYF